MKLCSWLSKTSCYVLYIRKAAMLWYKEHGTRAPLPTVLIKVSCHARRHGAGSQAHRATHLAAQSHDYSSVLLARSLLGGTTPSSFTTAAGSWPARCLEEQLQAASLQPLASCPLAAWRNNSKQLHYSRWHLARSLLGGTTPSSIATVLITGPLSHADCIAIIAPSLRCAMC